MLSVLAVNIGPAARQRVETMLDWLAARPEDVFLLTETSAGLGTAFLLDRFREAGYAVVHTPDARERGAALISRVPIVEPLTDPFAGVSVPGQVAAGVLATDPAVTVLGVHVPTCAAEGEFRAAVDALPVELRRRLVIGGDFDSFRVGADLRGRIRVYSHLPETRGFTAKAAVTLRLAVAVPARLKTTSPKKADAVTLF